MSYPKLVKSTKSELIVYLLAGSQGYVISGATQSKPIGYYSTTWNHQIFFSIPSTPELRKVMQQIVPGFRDPTWLKAMQ